MDKAIENNIERVRGDLTNVLREKGVSGVNVERVEGTVLHITVPSANAERLRGVLKSDFAYLVEAKSPQTTAGTSEFFLTLSKEEMRSLRDYAIDQSLETIRNRIDQFGVSEPIIQRARPEKYSHSASRYTRSRARQGDHRQDGACWNSSWSMTRRTWKMRLRTVHRPAGRCCTAMRGEAKAVGNEKQAYVVESRTIDDR